MKIQIYEWYHDGCLKNSVYNHKEIIDGDMHLLFDIAKVLFITGLNISIKDNQDDTATIFVSSSDFDQR